MFLKRLSVWTLVLLLPGFLYGSSAFFQDVSLSLHGYYRVRHYNIWNLSADSDEGVDLAYFTHQFRLKPVLDINEFIQFNLDILAFNNVFGNNEGNLLTMSTADTDPNIILKRAYAKIMLPVGALLAGRMPSHFGLGIFSNDGDHPVEFGDTDEGIFGNTYDRVLFVTKPMGKDGPMLLGLFMDKVVSGQNLLFWNNSGDLSLDFGDRSDDVNDLGMFLKYEKGPIKSGFYYLIRTQKSTNSNLNIPDFCFSWKKDIFHVEFELAYVTGKTRAFPIMVDGLISNYRVTIDSFGSVLRVGANVKPLEDVYLELGYASGDKPGNQAFEDLKYTQFSFDPNYKVGLLMFDYVDRYFTALKAQETVEYLKSIETLLKGIQAGNGLSESLVDYYISFVGNFMPSHGSIRNAFYLFPVLKYKPVDSVQLKLAFLGAWVAGSSYKVETRHEVGVNGTTKVYGQGSNYGYEVDFGIKFQYTDNVALGLQSGLLFPGNIFEKADGSKPDTVYTVIPRLTITF